VKCRAFLLVLALATNASADLNVRALAGAMAARPSGPPGHGVLSRPNMSALIELPESDDPRAFGLPRIGSHFSVARGSVAELATLATAHPTWRVTWSAPLKLLSDRAGAWSRAPAFRNDTGLTGKGVFVGIVDAAFDVAHPDFRNPDGTTRIAYLVDFSREPLGLHPELETLCLESQLCKRSAEASITGELPYAVLTAADIDAILLGAGPGPVPTDPEGHGTHVASLAAGNGGPTGKYAGVAPQASLVLVRAADGDGFIDNAVIPAATSLIFSLAERSGAAAGLARVPTVVNLSLGTDFGNHDGTSALEKSLAEMVGRNHPGRAIVAAAGNSAGVANPRSQYPAPLGIHTEVHVPMRSSLRVPIVTEVAGEAVSGAILVWISFRPGDEISVGLDKNDGPIIVPQRPGSISEHTEGELTVDIVNRSLADARISPDDRNAAAVIIRGSWPTSRTFAIRLQGHGTANLWVQTSAPLGEGDALFPAATKESTISIPAASPSVIAVGATLNRTEWIDRNGNAITVPSFGGLKNPEPDSVVFFSGAGPTADLRMKPDIVAPGAFVVGAMSGQADPKDNLDSVFAGSSLCDDVDEDCTVVDDGHAVLSGTSMASPIVTGAVALLFEENPDRTQDEMLALLQAGARYPTGFVRTGTQLGAGALDLGGILDVERSMAVPASRTPSREKSWLNLGASYAHPDATWRIPAILQLRDESGLVADAVDDELAVEVGRGTVTERLERVAPGFYRFAVAASDGTGGDTLNVAIVHRGSTLLSQDLPIGVDVNVARGGFSARGGCSTTPGSGRAGAWLLAGALVLTAWTKRRRKSAARTVRNRGRTDKWAPNRRGSSRK
jgi:MYXO-CTERM domain-containing protein